MKKTLKRYDKLGTQLNLQDYVFGESMHIGKIVKRSSMDTDDKRSYYGCKYGNFIKIKYYHDGKYDKYDAVGYILDENTIKITDEQLAILILKGYNIP